MSVAESPIKVQLRVVEAASRDVSRGIVRVDPTDIAALGARNGDLVLVTGKKTALGKLLPAQRKMIVVSPAFNWTVFCVNRLVAA